MIFTSTNHFSASLVSFFSSQNVLIFCSVTYPWLFRCKILSAQSWWTIVMVNLWKALSLPWWYAIMCHIMYCFTPRCAVSHFYIGWQDADLMAGSLIKNPGGTIAPCGGYVAGKKKLVEAAAARLSAPGLGVDCGSTPGDIMRAFFQGLFLSPQMVGEAIKVPDPSFHYKILCISCLYLVVRISLFFTRVPSWLLKFWHLKDIKCSHSLVSADVILFRFSC